MNMGRAGRSAALRASMSADGGASQSVSLHSSGRLAPPKPPPSPFASADAVPAAAPRPARRNTGFTAVRPSGDPVRSGSGFSSPGSGRAGGGRAGSGRLGSGLRLAAEPEQPAAAIAAPPTPFYTATPLSDADAQPGSREPARGAVWRPRRGASFSRDDAMEAPPPPLPQAGAARPLASALSAERERGAPGEPLKRALAADTRATVSPAAADAALAHAAAPPQPAHAGGSGEGPDAGAGPFEAAGSATSCPTVQSPASPFASAGAGGIQSDRLHRGPPCGNTPAPASPREARERRNGAGWPNGGPPQHRRSASADAAAACLPTSADWSADMLRPARTSAGRLAGAPRSPFDASADVPDAKPAGALSGAAEGGPAQRAQLRHSDAETEDGVGCMSSGHEGGAARRRPGALKASGAAGARGAPAPGPSSLSISSSEDVDSLVGLHRE